jgi:hypothetical protein
MSEWAALGLVAAALYVVECLAWIESAAVVCARTLLRRRWSCAQGATLPGNDRGGVQFVDPTSIQGSLVVCHRWPFSLSPEGVTDLAGDGASASAFEPQFVAFDDLKTVASEFGEIHLNGTRFARVSSSVLAAHLAEHIRRVWHLAPSERESEIKAAIRATLDDKGARATWKAFEEKTWRLSLLCNGLLVLTFLVAPLVFYFRGPYPAWKYVLASVGLVTVVTAVTYFRTHAALYPRCAYERWVDALAMVLLPVAAIRCSDKLSRNVLCHFSWAVVTPMLCDIEDATRVSRLQFVDLSRPMEDGGPAAAMKSAVDCALWFRGLLISETGAALKRLKVAVSKAPARDDETMIFFCPRCHAQFGRGANDSCPVCAGIHLVEFDRARGSISKVC